jgi:hypothetical protein
MTSIIRLAASRAGLQSTLVDASTGSGKAGSIDADLDVRRYSDELIGSMMKPILG